ncbi:methionyl-tRNA formyltransferase [Corynebacterium caspium]|uniref:methionyl-tRNA formyltransferase n=1 Tax=Corynebacterium caspium TaxID=234828 RepID=UPI00036F1231|nr:methionyl-tRNA formyltransferase [Corynebacterium caspium]WKD59224.1 Methionyl-tRNA formyltransferase [Corynebacterium caspium DSM 44850]
MRIIFAGTPEPAVVALEKLIASEHEVIAVITRPDARRGRGRTLHPSPVAVAAEKHGIEILKPKSLKLDTTDGQALYQRLTELQPAAIPVVAYGNLIPTKFLELPEHGWINLHFSLLPAWRGASPVQWAIHNGDKYTGATTFRIDEGLDTGLILQTLKTEIQPTDTSDDLLSRLAYSGADLLVETLDHLAAGTATFLPQEGQATYAPKISTADARIDWTQSAQQIDQAIRAFSPGPGAWTLWEEQRVKIGPVGILTTDPNNESSVVLPAASAPGTVHIGKNEVLVSTGSGQWLKLGQIQPPGKKMMAAADWARGLHDNAKDVTFQ